MNLFRPPRFGWLHSGLMALAIAVLAIVILVAWLPRVAGAAIQAPEDGSAVCSETRYRVLLEHERTITVTDEVTVTEQLFQKQIKVHGEWQDYPGITRWEPADFTEEGWIAGVRYRYRPTEESRTVVIAPAVTERLVEWFDSTPPQDGWTPTGRAEVTAIDVEVPCDDLPCACLPALGAPCDPPPGCPQPEYPPIDEPDCPGDPECPTPPGREEPPIDHGPEPEADHTDAEPGEPEVGLVAAERPPTLPRTGVETWHLIALAVGLASLGASLLVATRNRQETTP